MMKRTWIGVVLVAASVAGCGQGHVIFNVDVFSWLQGSGKQTIPYAAVSGFPIDTSKVQKISLPGGLGSSFVDTVAVTGNVNFVNTSGGPGSVGYQVYLASDSAGTYAASPDSVFSPPIAVANISGSNTVAQPFAIPNLSPNGNALFTGSEIWVRLKVHASSTVGTLSGNAVLTGLNLHVVIQDKVF